MQPQRYAAAALQSRRSWRWHLFWAERLFFEANIFMFKKSGDMISGIEGGRQKGVRGKRYRTEDLAPYTSIYSP